MPAPDAITNDKLLKLIGTPRCPFILDNRRDPIRAEDPRLLPGARALSDAEMEPAALDALIANLTGPVIVVCAEGHGRSQGLAALLRSRGIAAEYLDQGHNGWRDAGLPLINADRITGRDRQGRSLWITRSRPKIDRIACPWLIRRFVDPRAVFLYVAPTEVVNVADLLGGMPFDIEGVFWSHRDETCTFDTMLAEFGLSTPLLAASLGLSRMYADDLDQLEAGMGLYDAFYRWCRDATEETHNWPTNKPGAPT